jgi:DNA helicase-2/ATP-dependent DNA helicase PcrA
VEDRRETLIAQACRRLGLSATPALLRHLEAEIGWTKQSNVVPEDYAGLARAARRGPHLVSLDQVAEVLVAYEQAKQAACVIDLDDVLLCTVALLDDEPEVLRRVRVTYRHFVFDEFQDVSPVQAKLAELWVGGRADVCVVGDPAQTIHGFAGARPDYLVGFAARHSDAISLQLTRNYRSTAPIVALANRLSPTGLALRAVRADGEPVEFSAHRDVADEGRATAAWLVAQHADGLDWTDLAVLYRTRAQAEALRPALVERQVPFAYQGVGRGVHLGTLHSAKGLEWAGVALAGLHDASLPHPLATSAAQLAEERRLLYVGVTRAQSRLRLSWPMTVETSPTGPSRFLGAVLPWV